MHANSGKSFLLCSAPLRYSPQVIIYPFVRLLFLMSVIIIIIKRWLLIYGCQSNSQLFFCWNKLNASHTRWNIILGVTHFVILNGSFQLGTLIDKRIYPKNRITINYIIPQIKWPWTRSCAGWLVLTQSIPNIFRPTETCNKIRRYGATCQFKVKRSVKWMNAI